MHILKLKIEWTASDRKELEARKTTEIDVIGHVLLLIGAVPLSISPLPSWFFLLFPPHHAARNPDKLRAVQYAAGHIRFLKV